MDTLRTKHFRAESICLVFQNIQAEFNLQMQQNSD